MDKNIEDQITLIANLYKRDEASPFPYVGCRKVLQYAPGDYEGFIPDLSFFFARVAGYCSWGEQVKSWSDNKIRETRKNIGKTFFKEFPKYLPLQAVITESLAPDLFSDLRLHETMRQAILELLDLLPSS